MKNKLLALLLVIFCTTGNTIAQYILRPMTARYYNASQRGNIVYVSNSLINTGFTGQTTENPPTGTSTNNSAVGNHIDVDGDGTTANSSTADLNLPSCTTILFAGLYWSANQGSSTNDTAWITSAYNTCKLKLPGGSYQTITSTQTDLINQKRIGSTFKHAGYLCFKNITSLVTALSNSNGTYTVGGIVTPVDGSRQDLYGGWTIVIAYADPTQQVRNLTVFDGCVGVGPSSGNVDVNVSGFLTPLSGPVSCELGAVVYDGDRSSVDSFKFKQAGAASFLDLTPTGVAPGNATSTTGDMWNSTISYKGAVVTTRNPSFVNTYGYDADIFEMPNPLNANLGNNKTSATVRFFTPSETYILHVLTTSISVYDPAIAFSKTATDVNLGTLVPGDILRYRVNFQNMGNDSSTNTIVTDNIPAGTAFVPGTLNINGTAKTDGPGDDEAEYNFATNRVTFRIGKNASSSSGGNVGPGVTGYVEFDVATPSSCKIVTCTGPIKNDARIDYKGKTTTSPFIDSSGVNTAGCIVKGPISSTLTGACYNPIDTILKNNCPTLSLRLPTSKYAGYTFYSAMPFIPANVMNPYVNMTTTRTVYAYYNTGAGCSDTITIHIFINGCPDIDDDDDGLPDYLELNNPLAIQDADGDGLPNWYDTDYTYLFIYPYRDYNLDGSNDIFDPAADYDNDGIPNFYDTNYPFYTDSNGDAVNDNMDKDLDGIPNNYDIDSDNDGIPDTVESFGVDANGDGRIDNYSDLDADGLSDNVDANTNVPGGTWLRLSGLGLGALDTDSDLLPNYLDLDSDNDGIPDITEAFGTDAANSARVSSFTDIDGDGYTDALDADVGNDLVAENSASSLLRTSADGNGDGKTDTWPNKNIDGDTKPNPYDLDSDGDGILDVTEAQFTDANRDGRVDGLINADGRNTALAALGSLTIPNTDGVGRSNPFDIDSDEDGIPDNVEGMSTSGYLLPAGADTDNDGIDNTYDSYNGFGGNGITAVGITPVNTDADSFPRPDYIDSDTDDDGKIDRIEGNDFNFNGLADDLVTLTGTDTDGDGLDDRFDANNSSAEATSARMGNGGTITGDPTPGSTTVVQRTVVTWGCSFERDWRCLPFILSCEFLNVNATFAGNTTRLNWAVLCKQEIDYFIVERSTDRQNFTNAASVQARSVVNEVETYNTIDDVTTVNADIIYYRIKAVAKNGRVNNSIIVAVRKQGANIKLLQILPNPVTDQLQVLLASKLNEVADVLILDASGKILYRFKENLQAGSNTITYSQVASLASGVYYLKVMSKETNHTAKFNVVK